MKLYVFPPSPRSFKVLAVAAHLGIDHELAIVDLTKGEQLTDRYGTVNPNRRAPVLVDDGFHLWESNAIVGYLAEQHPEGDLLPADPKGRADVARWQYWEAAHWDAACARIIFERVVKKALGLGEPDAAVVAAGEKELERCGAVLDAHLRDRRYLTGDRLTSADFVVAADLTLTEAAALPIASYSNVKRWYADLSALPGWQDALGLQARFLAGELTG